MFICEGIYKETVNKIRDAISKHQTGLLVLGIVGSRSSGKFSVPKEALQFESVSFDLHRMGELSCTEVGEFVTLIHNFNSGIVLQFSDLPSEHKSAFTDYITSCRLGIVGGMNKRVLLIPSLVPLNFVDENMQLPDLCTSVETRQLICDALLAGFPLDENCPISGYVFDCGRMLSIGDLCALIRSSKLLALSSATRCLSCVHLLKSFNGLNLPLPVVRTTPNLTEAHLCVFIVDKLLTDQFIGLSPENVETIACYLTDTPPRKPLLIEGPPGSGKSFLASCIGGRIAISASDILCAKIGESEKCLFNVLSSKSKNTVVEDIDKIFPSHSETTGSIQRCLPVFLSFVNRWKYGEFSNKIVIGTTRSVDNIHHRCLDECQIISLTNSLSFDQKLQLIKSQYPAYSTTNQFDLINLNDRGKCIAFGKNLKMDLLRKELA